MYSQKLNRVQRHLLSFGYPMSIVKEYKQNSKHYREEVRDYYETKALQGNSQKRR